jgi:hypothetical protein
VLAAEIEKQLAAEAKKRRAATLKQNQTTVQESFPERDIRQARDKAAEMVGANPHYVTDAKKIERDAPEVLEHVKQRTLQLGEGGPHQTRERARHFTGSRLGPTSYNSRKRRRCWRTH